MSAERHIKVFRVIGITDEDESDTKVKDEAEAKVKVKVKVKAEVECRRFQFNSTSFSEFEKLVGKIFRLEEEAKFSLVYCKTFDAFGNRIDPFKAADKIVDNDSSVIVISSDKDFAAAWSASILDKEEDPTVWEVIDDVEIDTNTIGAINPISVLRLHLKTQ